MAATRPVPTLRETLFIVDRNIGDGNCALYGVAKMLKKFGINTTHRDVRTAMCDELINNKEFYWDFVWEDVSGQGRLPRFTRFVNRMREDFEYIDNVGLKAIVNVYPQLKKLCLVKEDVNGALQCVQFRASDEDELTAALMKSVTHKSVRDAAAAGCLFMLFKPGVGEKELGGHYDNLVHACRLRPFRAQGVRGRGSGAKPQRALCGLLSPHKTLGGAQVARAL